MVGFGLNLKYLIFSAVKDRSMQIKFPWHAIIISDGKMCGGSLIDKHLVLTSASCVVG